MRASKSSTIVVERKVQEHEIDDHCRAVRQFLFFRVLNPERKRNTQFSLSESPKRYMSGRRPFIRKSAGILRGHYPFAAAPLVVVIVFSRGRIRHVTAAAAALQVVERVHLPSHLKLIPVDRVVPTFYVD